MVTSFYRYNDVTNRRAASVRLFVFYLSLGLVRVCEINRIHPTRGPTIPVGNEAFPLNGGPKGWDFSGPTEHQ